MAQNLAKDGKSAKCAQEQKGQKGLEDLHEPKQLQDDR
jgi:hypothetical protein